MSVKKSYKSLLDDYHRQEFKNFSILARRHHMSRQRVHWVISDALGDDMPPQPRFDTIFSSCRVTKEMRAAYDALALQKLATVADLQRAAIRDFLADPPYLIATTPSNKYPAELSSFKGIEKERAAFADLAREFGVSVSALYRAADAAYLSKHDIR